MDALKSKKFKAFLLGVFGVFLSQVLGLPESIATQITEGVTILAGTYIGSQGIADAARDFRPKT